MTRFLTLLFFIGFTSLSVFGQKYKDMMADPSYNFYEVCEAAERYFNTIDKYQKGSGYKGFLRWKNNTEYMYYPSGNRERINPAFAKAALAQYKRLHPEDMGRNATRMSGWRELGPNSVDEITGHYSAGIGRIEEVYADPANMSKLYLGSRSGGLWRSLDEGNSWQGGATDFLPGSGVNTFAVDPTNTDHLLVNVRNSRNGYSYGVYESVDGGVSLTETAFNPVNLGEGGLGSNFSIGAIVYHPTIPNMVLVGTNKGLYKSTDNLATWTKVVTSGTFNFIKFHPTNPSIVYTVNHSCCASNRDYLWKSSDTGDSFAKTQQITGNNGRSGRIEVSAAAPSNVYFANSNGIHKSTDEGERFALIAVPSATGGVGAFGINSTNELNMITGGIDAYRSDDEGASFTQVTYWSLGSSQHGSGTFQSRYDNSTVYVHADLRKINSVNGVFYMGTDGSMVKSTDGGTTWIDLMRDGVGVRENYKLGVSQSNNGVAICGSQDNGTSIYKDTGWIEFYGADGMEGFIHPLNADYMIGSIQNGGRRRTTDGGSTQDGVTPSGSASGNWQAPIAYDPNDHMVVYDFRDGVRKSEDFGTSHSLMGYPSFSGTMQVAEIAQNNSDVIVVSSGSSIEKSIDGGISFASIKGNLPNHSIQDIAFDPLDDNRIIVVNASYQNNGQKVYMTTDGGTTWTNITFNIGDIPVHSVVIDHDAAKNIYLGTEVGVFTKPMSGSSWTLYSTGLPNTTVEELEIVYGANTIKAATWGRGLWEYDLVGRAAYPSINYVSITDNPTDSTPKEGTEQFVTASINYSGALSNVYVRWSTATPDFTIAANTIAMSNTSGNTWVSNTEIPNQIEGTKVYFKVFAQGQSGEVSETYKFMYTVKPFEVCTPSVQNGTSDYINLFEVDNSSGSTVYSNPSANDGYTAYNNTPIALTIGEDYTFHVQLQGAFPLDDAAVWIDFNQNAVFEDSESVAMSAYVSNISLGTIQIPVDAETDGTILMRVRNSYFNTPQPCNFDAGEVEDYIVQIVDPCTTVTRFDGSWNNGLPTASTRAIVSSDLNLSSSGIEACSLEIATGATLTIGADQYARIQGNIKIDGTLIVAHQASLVQVFETATSEVGITGRIEIQKQTPILEPLGFMFLSSPLSLETSDGVYGSVNNSHQAFRIIDVVSQNFVVDPALEAYLPYAGAEIFMGPDNSFLSNHTASEFLIPGDGLVVYPQPSITAGNAAYALTYRKGILNNGDIRYPVQYNGQTKNNFNLIGNPYASAIDVNALIDTNDMINEVYFWEHLSPPTSSIPGYNGNNYSMNDISIRNLSGGTAAANGGTAPGRYIASGQGFAIKAIEGGASDVLFTNSMRVVDNNDQYRQHATKDRLWLQIEEATYGLHSSALIAFDPQASEAIDLGYDSKRVASSVAVFSTTKNRDQLGIQTLGSFDKTTVIPLGIASELEETLLTVSLPQLEGEHLAGVPVYLIDTQLDRYINLKERDYSFTTTTPQDLTRFFLAFEDKQGLGVEEARLDQSELVLYPNPASDKVMIAYTGQIPLRAIKITSINGQELYKTQLLDNLPLAPIAVGQWAKGIYFVTISTAQEQITKKLILK